MRVIQVPHHRNSFFFHFFYLAAAASPDQQTEEQATQEKLEAFLGPMHGGPGKWASCIRIVDPALVCTCFQ